MYQQTDSMLDSFPGSFFLLFRLILEVVVDYEEVKVNEKNERERKEVSMPSVRGSYVLYDVIAASNYHRNVTHPKDLLLDPRKCKQSEREKLRGVSMLSTSTCDAYWSQFLGGCARV